MNIQYLCHKKYSESSGMLMCINNSIINKYYLLCSTHLAKSSCILSNINLKFNL